MTRTPRSLRVQIGLFGRTNAGKSSILNMIAGQQVSITSEVHGTTTDVVEKSMELLPIGPVVFLDTAGIDDCSALGEKRVARTQKVFRRADVAVLVVESGIWGEYEDLLVRMISEVSIPLIVMISKVDLHPVTETFLEQVRTAAATSCLIPCNPLDQQTRNSSINTFKQMLLGILPEEYLSPPPLLGDLIPSGAHVLCITPIDIEAPKGRLILPQVQAIRDILDADAWVTVVKEHQYEQALKNCIKPPDLVICDSQVVDLMVKTTPEEIPCTTFSTLFCRYKGDLLEQVRGAAVLDHLGPEDRILISEACSHHAMDDDIGRVKIPAWLKTFLGFTPLIDMYSGRDYPENLHEYALVIHCGACMLTRREMLLRIELAREAGVPVTNYGICIAHMHGMAQRIITPFPGAVAAWEENQSERKHI